MKKTLIHELKRKNKNYKSHNSGITLIALIITIVVLLILAVVAIRAIKNDGIIEQAKSVTDKYKKKQREEESTLNDYLSLLDETDLIVHKDVIPTDGMYYIKDIDKVIYAGENFPKVIGDGDGYAFGDYVYTHHGLSAESLDDLKDYYKMLIETEEGKTWEQFLEEVGLTEEEFWIEIELTEDKWEEISNQKSYWSVEVKDKTKTEYGPILGKIEGSFVTDLFRYTKYYLDSPGAGGGYVYTYYGCFKNCTSLVTAPKIPASVTNMSYAFEGCTSLLTAPTIPNSVTDMRYTFEGCTSLVTAPEIPASVTNMTWTFSNCTSLVTAPEILASVTDMRGTFYNCTSLVTAPTIPNSVTDMDSIFRGCTSLTTAPEIPEGVTDMQLAFEGCTSLTTAPEIPASVTSMIRTFDRCTSLTGSITINANPTSYSFCLSGTQITSVVGETTIGDKILATK